MLRSKFLKSVLPITLCAVFVFSLTPLWQQAKAQAQQAPQYTMGVNILWGGGDMAAMEDRFKRMKSLGLNEARIDWEWRVVEKRRGTYDWSAFDRLVALADKYNVTLFPIVHYAPTWALPKTKKPNGTYEMAPLAASYLAYAQFLAASIDRYGPNSTAGITTKPIKYWQVWNEPNGKEFWGPKPDPAGFVKLMQTVNTTLGARRNLVKIVHAGLSKSDFSFLWQLWEQDANYGSYFDIMALHPYFFDPNGGVRTVDAMDPDEPEYAALGVIGSESDAGYLAKVFNVQLFLDLKKSPKPIWVTEIGFMAGTKNQWAISEGEEKVLANETLAFIDQKLTKAPFGRGARADLAANVEKIYWFTLDDYDFPDDTGNFGLFRTDGTAWPVAEIVKSYAK